MPIFEADQPPAPLNPVEPRDAATLILVRGGREILMGRRAQGSVFMPNKWVFPGGRVEDEDAVAMAASEFDAETEAYLLMEAAGRPARAFGLAAARETWEETGLKLGGAAGPRLCQFQFVARVITPIGPPRRFDTRFLLANAEGVLDHDALAAGEELPEIRWFSFAEAEALDLLRVTRFVLGEAQERLAGSRRPPVFARRVGDRAIQCRLGEPGESPGIE